MADTAEAPAQIEPEEIVRRLIGTVGVAGLVRLTADVTQDEADRLLMTGDRVRACAAPACPRKAFRPVTRVS